MVLNVTVYDRNTVPAQRAIYGTFTITVSIDLSKNSHCLHKPNTIENESKGISEFAPLWKPRSNTHGRKQPYMEKYSDKRRKNNRLRSYCTEPVYDRISSYTVIEKYDRDTVLNSFITIQNSKYSKK